MTDQKQLDTLNKQTGTELGRTLRNHPCVDASNQELLDDLGDKLIHIIDDYVQRAVLMLQLFHAKGGGDE